MPGIDLISQSMLFLLESLKAIVGNYGLAIIVLTVLVRAILWPISRSQMKSMKMMQDLQPKLKQIQDRYKSDPQKLQAEMFKLYKDYKFNPLGGCLPALIQLPLFLGLYWAISNPNFMAIGDPTFLNVIHLKHTGIVSHGGLSNNGEMSVAEPGKGGFLGVGKDHIVAGNTMRVFLSNGKVLERRVPQVNKALTVLPKEAQPGIPFQITTNYDALGLAGYQGFVKSIEMQVVNTGTKETEHIFFSPQGKNATLETQLQTVAGKTDLHMDVLILVLIFAITMLISQKLTAAQTAPTGNDQQQKMMKMMPLMFSVFLFIFPFPAGVLLYMDTNSIFQIFQAWMFQRESTQSGKENPPSQAILDIKPEA